jgi:TATA-box binding protein (TBP) (component of TFIID and TFIIIB)
MPTLENYISRIEKTCGEEKSTIVTFKYGKKNEVIKKILENAKLNRSLAGLIYELSFQGKTFRLYSSGKVIFKGIKEEETIKKILIDLIL